MSSPFSSKIKTTFRLLQDILLLFPGRIARILHHISAFPSYCVSPMLHGIKLNVLRRTLLWWAELGFLFFDIIGLPELYEIGSSWIKPRSRALLPEEVQLAGRIFPDTFPYHRLRIDERAYLGPRQYRFCYVSFCVINSWGKMSPAILIHELVHIWQFQKFGSPYILRALLAQNTEAGYDYGGIKKLQLVRKAGLNLNAFNYEQQAAIIEDFFRLQVQEAGRWAPQATPVNLETYRYFASFLSERIS